MKKLVSLFSAGLLALSMAFIGCSAEGGGGRGELYLVPEIDVEKSSVEDQIVTVSKIDNATGSALKVEASAAYGTICYQWTCNDADIAGATRKNYYPPITTVGEYRYDCKVYISEDESKCVYLSDVRDGGAVKVTVQPDSDDDIEKTNAATPAFNTNLVSGDKYSIGDTVTWTVSATATAGTNLVVGTITYQWYKDGTAVSGATSASYTLNTSEASVGTYYVVATNTASEATGNKVATVKSNEVTVAVGDYNLKDVAAVSITKDLSETLVEYEYNATVAPLSVAATANGNGSSILNGTLTYQWYKNGAVIPGATGAAYEPGVLSPNTYTFYVVITATNNEATGVKVKTATSKTATINVKADINAVTPRIDTNLNATAELVNGKVVLSIQASVTDGGTLTYQWYKGDAAISGATSSSYTATAAGNYKCEITNTISNGKSSKANSITCTVTAPQSTTGTGGFTIQF